MIFLYLILVNMNFSRAVITGGLGFIGCNSSDYFSKKFDKVTVIDNYSRKGVNENLEWLKKGNSNIDFVKADISKDFEILKKEFIEADLILHLAGQVAVTSSVKDPRS